MGSPAEQFGIGSFIGGTAMADFGRQVIDGNGVLDVDPDVIQACIDRCKAYVVEMRDLADSARRDLRFDVLGIGGAEDDLQSAKDLARKFYDKAAPGGDVEDANTAAGLLLAHAEYGAGVQKLFEDALARYQEQEAANSAALNAAGTEL